MATAYLGAKFDGHDTAAFLLVPHLRQAYGLSTERLTRVKHDRLFPVCAIERIAQQAAGALSSVDRICCANAFLSHRTRIYALDQYEREVESRRVTTSRAPSTRTEAATLGSHAEFGTLHEIMLRHLRRIFPGTKVSLGHFDHEYCHARSSYDFGPIDEALVLTMDGAGDGNVYSRAFIGRAGILTPVAASQSRARLREPRSGKALDFPCSLGGIYAYFTHLLGFVPNSDEGKLEALAAAGCPIPSLYESMMRGWGIGVDLSLQLDAEQLQTAINAGIGPEGGVMDTPADLAATVQLFLENVVIAYAQRLLQATDSAALCLSGGVFANVSLNMRMAGLVGGRMYVAPAIGDEGSAQGAASASLMADVGEGTDVAAWLRGLSMPYFGTCYSRADVVRTLERRRASLLVDDTAVDVPNAIARRIQAREIGALFQGRMEFGPRALGNRSILASPADIQVKDRVNIQIKRRPPFQPVCPAVLRSELDRLFPTAYANPHMTCAFPMAREHRTALPGAAHLDGTSRVQFVGPEDNALLFAILQQMHTLTGYGVVLNTSFNIHGKAIAESPDDAIDDFMESGMDFLVIEGILVRRPPP